MDLSPNDIRGYEFETQMRGYAKDDVDSFLDQVAVALETVKQENLKMSMEIDSLKTQLEGLRQFEDTIKNAAIDARRNADTTMANARQEAEELLGKARSEAEQIVGSRAQQVTDIEEQIAKSELIKRSYLTKLRTMIESHMEMVDALVNAEGISNGADDSGPIEVTDSAEVERNQMETVATRPSDSEPIETEEANAASEIVPADPSEQPAEASAEPEPEPESEPDEETTKPIDPELAAALESYQGREQGTEETPNIDTDVSGATGAIPASPGAISETTLKAEDIPPGFIARKEPAEGDPSATDRMETEEPTPKGAAAVIKDLPRNENVSRVPVDPDALASELDEVAAKFEEEMDKAAKG